MTDTTEPIKAAPKDQVVVVPLTRGQTTVVDEGDVHIVAAYTWQAHPRRDRQGFYAVSSNGVRMHRLLLGVNDSRIVDHIDGDGLNNRRSNLRAGTQSQNCVNRKRTPGKHMRGARPKAGKWQGYIKYQGKQRSLGYFDTEAEAHVAYVEESRRLHGDWMPLPAPPAKETL